ncbi:MAG: class I SAM-dependent methyltransferase [Planctomycetota bacterium]|nr:MAG: class I SAM-dependent methyltransferase [Planctomycetota bacterium]
MKNDRMGRPGFNRSKYESEFQLTTNYDPIAEQYKRSKQQPWRTHIEAFSLMQLIGDPTGKSVLDVACGEGFYSRMLKQCGATSVTGVDLSVGMIELAIQQEEINQQGIQFLVADAREYNPTEKYDLVIAAYLLNYAHNQQELQAMCDGIARCLNPGGRFITVNCSPFLHFPTAPSYRKYGFETILTAPWGEGTPITWRFHLSDGVFELENYHLNQTMHEEAFHRAGFKKTAWHKPQLSPDGLKLQGHSFWSDFFEHSPVAFIECTK